MDRKIYATNNIIFKYPKTYLENLRYRADILQKAEYDVEFQEILKESCRRDRLFWFNTFAYTYDPRVKDKDLPFITYPFQDTTILWDAQCAIDNIDNLLEKSRDMGATFQLVGNDLYDWMFIKEHIEIRWGSRKEQYVDTRGDMDSIFPKFRYMLNHLPKWMLPKEFDWNKHDNSMRLINPETGSSITGEATNEEFGRGGRKWRIRFDEFAFWDVANPAWEGAADATNCRSAISTPNGSANKFAILANEVNGIEKVSLHWTLHPDKFKGCYYYDGNKKIPVKDSAAGFKLWQTGVEVRSTWYDSQCERRTVRSVAQELDINYLKSGSPFFDLKALSIQKSYHYVKRQLPTDPIPQFSYIMGVIVEIRNKYVFRERDKGWLKIFELPRKNYQYVLSSDISEGLPKGDESFGIVRCKITRNVVATINQLTPPEDFAIKLFMIEKYYVDCKNAPEANNHGYTIGKELYELGSNLYYSRTNEESKSATKRRGFLTTARTRPLMLDRMEEEVRKNSCELRDPVLISQCKTFVHSDKGKPQADGNFLDDGVLAFAISGIIIDEYPYKPTASQDHKRVAAYHDKKRNRKQGFRYSKGN